MAYLGKQAVSRATGTSKDSFNGDGSTTAFTMSKTVHLVTDIEVFVDNVQQEPTTAYTISGTTLTFDEAPPNGTANVYVIHRSGNNDSMKIQSGITPTFTNVIIANDGTIGSASDNDAISINSSGRVTLTNNLTIPNDGNIGSVGDADAITIASSGLVTLGNNLKIPNDGNIGSAGDADSMAINSSGVVTFSQAPIITTTVWPAFRATLSSDQTGLSDAVYTKLELDTELFDTTGDYDSSTNYRFTPSVAGYYQLNGGAGDANNTTYQVYVGIYKNGSIYAIQGDYHASDGGSNGTRYARQAVSTVMHMNGSTDYAELFYFDNVASGTGTVHGGTGDGAFFDGILVQRTG